MSNIEQSILLKQELDGFRPLSKEDELRIMQKFRLDWNYHSNHLEGNSLTYGETKALILFGITAQGKPLKDHFEITGHDEATKWLLEIVAQERPLTEKFIRELHKLLLKKSYETDAITPEGNSTKKTVNVGVYKQSPNHVKTKTGEIFRFATPEETPAMMTDLLDWYQMGVKEKDVNPILLAAQFHYKFIRIHPFDDGNGRTARILMNFILMQFGYPPVIIKTEDKENYFAALRQADADIFEPFLEYIAQNLNRSLEIMIKGAKGESIEEPGDLDKEIALLAERLKSVGQPIEQVRTPESFSDIINDSAVRIAEIFVDKGLPFKKMYLNVVSQLFFNDKLINNFREIKLSISNLDFQEDKIIKVKIVFSYKGLNQVGLEKFNFIAAVFMDFVYSSYTVSTLDNTTKKLYGTQLTDAEIMELVNGESKRHKEAIEAQIKNLEQNK